MTNADKLLIIPLIEDIKSDINESPESSRRPLLKQLVNVFSHDLDEAGVENLVDLLEEDSKQAAQKLKEVRSRNSP